MNHFHSINEEFDNYCDENMEIFVIDNTITYNFTEEQHKYADTIVLKR